MTKTGYTALLLGLATLITSCATPPPQVRQYRLNDHFSAKELESGSTSNQEQCASTPDSLWITLPGHADCLRYYPSPLTGKTGSVLIFLSGDLLSGKPGHQHAAASYGRTTPDSLYRQVRALETRYQTAILYLARPGTLGSSGNHNLRRQQLETREINAAISQLKQRYNISALSIAGQSGGGGLVGALIAERSDIVCAVSSSGVTAVKMRANQIGGEPTGTAFSDLWDPIEQLDRVRPMPGFRMFVVSDPNDAEVPFVTQASFVHAAKKRGLDITQITMHGSGAKHHGLKDQGISVATACMRGQSTAEIVTTHQEK